MRSAWIAQSARTSSHVCSRTFPALGVVAAVAATDARGREHAEKLRQLGLALKQARYEATRARRHYEAVDHPSLVACEWEPP